MESIEERVLYFVGHSRGMAAKKISLDSRLLQDLNLEGEDAIEFFDKFGIKFDVDLSALIDQTWERHFGPEGGVRWSIVGGFFVCYLISEGLERVAGRLPQWGVYLGLIVIWAWVLRFWPVNTQNRELIPLTVHDLVDSAKAGKWVKSI